MKNINITFLFIFVFVSLQPFAFDKKYVIGTGKFGFFSGFCNALMHLIGCKKNNLIPVVYWDHYSPYYVENSRYRNVWEYYFDPVSKLNFEKNDVIHRDYHFPGAPYIEWRMPNYPRNFDYNFRKDMNSIIREYIKIKKPILEKVEVFYRNYMKGKKVIGVHVRQAVDKLPEAPHLEVDIFAKIVGTHEGQILVAADQYAVIEKFKRKFPGRVICYDAHRSSDSSPHFLGRDKKDPLNAVIGEEVLIEVLLLSRCELFIHSVSNVATAVLFFNPKLKNIFIDPTQKPKF